MVKTTTLFTKIELNGVDISSFLFKGSTKKLSNQQVNTGQFYFKRGIDASLTMDNNIVGKSFTIQRGFDSPTERYIFRGEVVSFKQQGSTYEINVANKMYAATRLGYDYSFNINTDVEAGVGSEIVKTLYTNAGLSYNDTTVVNTGSTSTFLLRIYLAQGPILDTLKDLCKVYEYTFFYKDSDDLAYFTPKGYNDTNIILTTGVDIVNRVQWLNTGENLTNNLTLIGGQQLDWATETFAGPSTQVTLIAKPVDTDVTVNGVKKQRGVNSSDPKDFYVDSEARILYFTASGTNIIVNYSYNVPVKVSISNYTSISNFVQYDRTIVDEKLTNTDDATLKANNIINDSSDVLTSAPLNIIGDNSIELNDVITIVDNINNKTVTAFVNSIEYSFPSSVDKITIGKVPIGVVDWMSRVSNNIVGLQRQLSSDTNINNQIINLNTQVGVFGYQKKESAGLKPNDLYWDVVGRDTWDAFKWGDDTSETYSELSFIPFNNTYYDDFLNTDFKGTTTATWTGNGTVNFTNGQIATSTRIVYDSDLTITRATLTVTSTGTLIFEISPDNTNWETITPGAEKTLTYTGNKLYWRATSTGISTLTKIKITYR